MSSHHVCNNITELKAWIELIFDGNTPLGCQSKTIRSQIDELLLVQSRVTLAHLSRQVPRGMDKIELNGPSDTNGPPL